MKRHANTPATPNLPLKVARHDHIPNVTDPPANDYFVEGLELLSLAEVPRKENEEENDPGQSAATLAIIKHTILLNWEPLRRRVGLEQQEIKSMSNQNTQAGFGVMQTFPTGVTLPNEVRQFSKMSSLGEQI